MNLNRPWDVRYHPARALLFLRGIYVLLTADLWFAMVQHGGRYGAGGFNVTHFAWLDRLLPRVSPTLYVGLLITSGLLSFALAVRPAPRALRVLLAGLYTASWMISLHDSYQHHYLLSWLLLYCAGYPDVSSQDVTTRDAELVDGWGNPITAITCGLVYKFTCFSKCYPAWCTGDNRR